MFVVVERALEWEDAGLALTVACAYALEVEVEAVEAGTRPALGGVWVLTCECGDFLLGIF